MLWKSMVLRNGGNNMLKVILSGCNGAMGRAITKVASESQDVEIVVGIDKYKDRYSNSYRVYDNIFDFKDKADVIIDFSHPSCLESQDVEIVVGIDKYKDRYSNSYRVYDNIFDFKDKADVIIDFSHPSCLGDILTYGEKNNTPIVIATTGLNIEDDKKIEDASKNIPIFKSANMSIGVNLLIDLVKKAALALQDNFDIEIIEKHPIFKSANMSIGVNLLIDLVKKAALALQDNFDIEIIEKHHNKKVDAPSGTALMIADAINEELDNSMEYKYGREGKSAKREGNEIGIHAIRGGTIPDCRCY